MAQRIHRLRQRSLAALLGTAALLSAGNITHADGPALAWPPHNPTKHQAPANTTSLATAPHLVAARPAAAEPVAPPLPSTESATELSADPSSEPGTAVQRQPASPTPSASDAKKGAELEAAAASAYKGVFYNNDFRYLEDPAYNGWHLGESLKRRPLGPWSKVDVGGEYRARFHHENNMRGQGLTGLDDDFLLHRTRLYINAELGENLRVYSEFLDSQSNYEDFAPRGNEENRADVLNLFGDVRLFDGPSGSLTGRAGRQELLYGSQRLVSPLDWSNTRRTFDGFRLMWAADDWKLDGFYTRPVIVDRTHFDQPDYEQEFYGLWSTYTGLKNQLIDLYWLGYHNYESPYLAVDSFKFQTVGGRWEASRGPWLSELEGGYQFGEFGAEDHSAGFFTIGVGHKFEEVTWKPTLWAYYDWASGSETIGDGFNHLFPLGHRYLGLMDFFGRTNIQDINLMLTMQPHERISFLIWWHVFYLQDSDDVPYTVTDRPFVTTPGGSNYLGQEIDLLLTWNMSARTEWVFGYSHFFTGDWYRTNPVASTGFQGDADFFYTQFTLRF